MPGGRGARSRRARTRPPSEVNNAEVTPSKSDAEEAIALIAAFEEHARRGAGAFAWKGQMMDMPHLTRARKIADRARQAGVL